MKRSGFNAGALSFSRRAAQGRFLSVDIGHPCIADQPPERTGSLVNAPAYQSIIVIW